MSPQSIAIKMLKMYQQIPNIDKNMWLTTFFKTTEEDITNAEAITLDIERTDEYVAPVLTDISTGSVVVSHDIYTNKTIIPPAMALSEPFNVFDATKRQPGETEYQAAERNAQVVIRTRMMKSWKKLSDMIKRTIEIQAAQLLQTGTMTLYDEGGNAAYTLDYKPKATHFPTTSVSWSNSGSADPLSDLEGLANVIRDDGFVDGENIIMGSTAFNNFLKNATVEKYFTKTGYFLGSLDPRLLNNGAKVQGAVHIGNYEFTIWTYNGRYIDLSDSTKKTYVDADKVIMLPNLNDVDFRKAFAAIPTVVDSDPRLRDVLPSRVSVPGAFDFKPRVFTDQKAESMFSEIKSRPILIPVSIDKYGCLDTEI